MMSTTKTLGTLGPVAVGCALIDPSAALAGRDIEGIRDIAPEMARKVEDAKGRGKAMLIAGNIPMALEMYRNALERDPNDIEAMNGIAVCYDRLGQYDVSRTYYETALVIDPTSPLLLNNYGYSLFLQGDLKGATRFLGLAAASGDPAVEAASLKILAKVEAQQRRTQRAAAPIASEATSGPQVVRTSSYEQRLVLKGNAPPVQMVATLGPEAATAVVAVTAMSEAEDRAIQVAEQVAIRQEILASRAAEAPAPPAPPVATPPLMQLAGTSGTLADEGALSSFDGFAPSEERKEEDWSGAYVLQAGPRPVPSRQRFAERDGPMLAALPSGMLVQRSGARPKLAKVLPAAEPLARKRAFETPFESDDTHLNGFAARVQGQASDIDARVALLQDLVERMKAA